MAAAKRSFGRIEVMDVAVWQALENADGGMLLIVAVLDIEVAVKRVAVAGDQADLAPAASLPPCAKPLQRCARYQDKVDLVSDVMRNGIVTVRPHAAHRAGALVFGCVHKMINDQAILAILKQACEARIKEVQRIIVAQVARTFAEHIILLDERSHGELTAELGHALTLILQRDFCSEQFIARRRYSALSP